MAPAAAVSSICSIRESWYSVGLIFCGSAPVWSGLCFRSSGIAARDGVVLCVSFT
jgi:hypothetical protein